MAATPSNLWAFAVCIPLCSGVWLEGVFTDLHFQEHSVRIELLIGAGFSPVVYCCLRTNDETWTKKQDVIAFIPPSVLLHQRWNVQRRWYNCRRKFFVWCMPILHPVRERPFVCSSYSTRAMWGFERDSRWAHIKGSLKYCQHRGKEESFTKLSSLEMLP